ncbi:MAG TPA: hypothetical protein VGM01_14055 [Ktedonobacteraceae bacterium]|jgi:hypothetical protein
MPTTYGTIQTMTRAYQQICTGEDPWIALGNFRNAWYGYAKDIRPERAKDPPGLPEPDTEHNRRWRAFRAASVEFLCDRYEVPCPEWVHNPDYALEKSWWHTRHSYSLSIKERLMRTTPAPFTKRNIFCGNRLFQNKYELAIWIQEARDQGMTDPGEIWRYVHEKEVSIHGG